MKKIFSSVAVLAFAFAIAFTAHGQKPTAVSNHSVNLQLHDQLGLGYTYEYSFGGNFTLLGTASLDAGLYLVSTESFGLSGNTSEEHISYTLRPAIEIQPRYYYNFGRRADKGRNTNLNSANYVAVQMKYGFPSIVHDDVELQSTRFVSLVWGLRRVWDDKWLFEFWAGPSYSSGPSLYFEWGDYEFGSERDMAFSVNMGVKFGFVF